MVRLSAVLCKIRYAKRQKYIREKKGVYTIDNHSYRAESILQGINICVKVIFVLCSLIIFKFQMLLIFAVL